MLLNLRLKTISSGGTALNAAIEEEITRKIANGKPIVPSMIADALGSKLPFTVSAISDMGYHRTDNLDDKSHMEIWEKARLLHE